MPHSAELCDHCGLPARGGVRADGQVFCCYGCYLVRRITGKDADAGPATFILVRLGLSAFLAMNIMMISLLLYTRAPEAMEPRMLTAFRWALLVLSTPVLVLLGGPFIASAIRGLSSGQVAMDALVAVGCVAAYGVSAASVLRGHEGRIYFDTATMLMVLVTVGKFLEASAKTRTANLVKGLLQLGATEATVLRDGREESVPVEEVQAGDELIVRPGERIPADGVILSGRSAVSEAPFTGEATPRTCGTGDRVYGGSVNGEGRIALRTTGVGADSLLGQMARLVEEAQRERAPVERLADRLAAGFVILVWATALGALAYWSLARGDTPKGAMAALAVLVVACPCALGIATPLATSVAIGRAAQMGALIRSGAALEVIPRLDRMFLDKTGTLTRGTMEVSLVEPIGDMDERELLSWLAPLERESRHPIGRAIAAYAEGMGVSEGDVLEAHVEPGRGVVGRIVRDRDERGVVAGTAELMDAEGIPASGDAARGHGVLVAIDGAVRARIDLADRLRPEAPAVVTELAAGGIQVALLSGDREATTAAVARELGIEGHRAECTPTDKLQAVRAAVEAGETVAMVGDGVNDAPALAAASLGIAMAGGTDLARESSDVTLLGDGLERLPWLCDLSRRAYAIIRGNLAWAFGYNVVCITIAAMGLLHPLLAAGLMLLSSLTVLGNSLRLLAIPGPEAPDGEGVAISDDETAREAH